MKATSLIGNYFHSIGKDTGKVEWQGVVISRPMPGWYLVQLFDWIVGDPSVRRVVKLDDMESWLFYPDAEVMRFSYEHGTAREGGCYRDRLPKD